MCVFGCELRSSVYMIQVYKVILLAVSSGIFIGDMIIISMDLKEQCLHCMSSCWTMYIMIIHTYSNNEICIFIVLLGIYSQLTILDFRAKLN